LAQISHTENVFIYFILNRYCIKRKCQKRDKDDDDDSENSVFQTPLLPPPPPILMGPCGVPQRRFEHQSERVVSHLHHKYFNDNGSY